MPSNDLPEELQQIAEKNPLQLFNAMLNAKYDEEKSEFIFIFNNKS